MIEIKIINPHDERPEHLRAIANFLTMVADNHKLPDVSETLGIPAPVLSTTATTAEDTPKVSDILPPIPVNPFAKPPAPVVPPLVVEVVQPAIPVPPPFAPTPVVTPVEPADPTLPVSSKPKIEVDAKGLPWDARIHSRTKSKTINGSWKLMRGVTPDTVRNVEAELQQVMTVGVPGPAPYVPGTPAVPAFIPPTPIPTSSAMDFPALMNKVTQSINAGLIDSPAILKIVQEMGLTSLPIVATRPDLIPALMQRIEAAIVAGGK